MRCVATASDARIYDASTRMQNKPPLTIGRLTADRHRHEQPDRTRK